MAFDIDQALQMTTTATATRTFDVAGIDTMWDVYDSFGKMEQYFRWLDTLSAPALAQLHQTQKTLDMNKLERIEKERHMTKQTMEELGEIMNQYGMAPTDLNIPAFSDKIKTYHTHLHHHLALPATPVPQLKLSPMGRGENDSLGSSVVPIPVNNDISMAPEFVYAGGKHTADEDLKNKDGKKIGEFVD